MSSQHTSLKPDFIEELRDLAKSQDAKLATQKKEGYASSKEATQTIEKADDRMSKEASDIFNIAESSTNTPKDSLEFKEFILQGVQKYADREQISLLAAKARVSQYLSPEYKESVDLEIKAYLLKNSVLDVARLPEGSPDRTKRLSTLSILKQEGYLGYHVLFAHYALNKTKMRTSFQEYDDFLQTSQVRLKQEMQKSFFVKEKFIFKSAQTLPQAKRYLGKLQKDNLQQYQYAIDLAFHSLKAGQMIKETYYYGKKAEDRLDCDERTLLLQKLSLASNLEIGNYVQSNDHVSLKLDGFPLVLDTYDMRLCTIGEFARQERYESLEQKFYGSYFWRDDKEYYLAVYEESDTLPRKITGYRKVEKDPYLVSENEDLSGIWVHSEENKDLPIADRINLYELVLEFNPNYAEAYSNLGTLLLKAGDPKNLEKVQECYEKSLKLNPNNADAYNGLGVLLSKLGDLQDLKRAKECYEKALELNPNDDKIYNNFGALLSDPGALRDLEKAQEYYEKSLELNPKSSEAYNNLGALFGKQGKQGKAVEYFRKALKFDPDNVLIQDNLTTALKNTEKREGNVLKFEPADAGSAYSLGALSYKAGNLEEAKAYFKKALELDPRHANAHNALGAIFYQQNNLVEAEQYYKKSINLNTDNIVAYSNLVLVLNKQNKIEEMKKYGKEVLKLDFKIFEIYYKFGAALLEHNYLVEAEEQFRKVITLNFKHADTFHNLGVTLYRQGSLKEAKICFKRALELNPEYAEEYEKSNIFVDNKKSEDDRTSQQRGASSDTQESIDTRNPKSAEAHIKLGDTYYEKGNMSEAEKHYREALKLGHESNTVEVETYCKLGDALLAQGKLEDALNSYKIIVQAYDPKHAEAHYGAGKVFYEKGDLKSAEKQFREVLKLDPNHAEARHNLGVVLGQQSRLEGGKKER